MRIKTIDYTKFMAVVMVVLGHCLAFGNGKDYYAANMQTDNLMHNYIYSFHMPIFAILSGWLFSVSFRKYSVKEMLVNRIKTLFIPIIAWQLLINAFSIIMNITQGKQVTNPIIRLIKYNNVINNMWFLWSILICSLLVIVIRLLLKDKLIAYVLVICLTLFVKPYIFQLWLWLFPFFAGAYLFEKHKEKFHNAVVLSNNIFFISGLLLIHLVTVIYWNVDYYIYIEYGQALCLLGRENPGYNLFVDIYRLISGTMGSIGYILLINKILTRIKMGTVIEKFILAVSKYSLGIYVFSVYMLNPILRNLPFREYSLVTNIVQTVVILFISVFVIGLIDKVKVLRKMLLGRR